ncbi:MAG: hypothetical protein V3U92_04200 [Cellulophaga sp.]
MKNITLFLIVIFLFSCTKDKDDSLPEIKFLGEIEWVKNFGGSGEETAQSVIETSDGGYAVFGYTNSIDGDVSGKTIAVNDYWLLKLDAAGNLQWNKTYGGSKDDRGQSVIETKDNGFAITGYSKSDDGDASNNEGFHDNWILKLDTLGNIEWERSFGFSGHDHSYDLLQTEDGGFFFIGFLDITAAKGEGNFGKNNASTRHGVGEYWGTKLDSSGNLEWRRYFGGTNNDRAHAVVQANDGGFVLTGFSESNDFDISNSKGSYDFWVIKINDKGTLLWERSFGGTEIEVSNAITKTNTNEYVIVGQTFSDNGDVSKNNGGSDIWVLKIDDTGNMLWEQSFGGTEFDSGEGVSVLKNDGFIISGNSKSEDKDAMTNAGENDMWLLRTDANGKLLWQGSFGGSGLDYGFDTVETNEKAIVLVGESASTDFKNLQNKGKTDVVVIKIK